MTRGRACALLACLVMGVKCGVDDPNVTLIACDGTERGCGGPDGNTPEFCRDGEWIPEDPCPASTPICNAGACEGGGGGEPSAGAPGSGAGGEAGTIGTGGVGGEGGGEGGAPNPCVLEPDSGSCDGVIRRFAFDRDTGLCHPFVYGGCDGNDNNFESIDACFAACGGQGEIDPALCESPPDCTLIPTGCCDACAGRSLENVIAVNAAQVASVNVTEGLNCEMVDCMPCSTPNPWLSATCREGRCVAYDARETELTECTSPSQCVVRAGLSCCQPCVVGDWVALNRDVELEPWACGDAIVACPDCVLPPPPVSATCEEDRCQVVPL